MRPSRKPSPLCAVRLGWPLSSLLVVIVVTTFAPVVTQGFVNWDDPENFIANPHLRAPGWHPIIWAWGTNLLDVYQPLGWMLIEGEYALWGLNPQGYHAVSLVLHAANAVVLARVIVVLLVLARRGCAVMDALAMRWAAFVGAALFAVHPLRAEVVAWVSSQSYLPCALLAMLALRVYLGPFLVVRAGDYGLGAGRLTAVSLLYAAALLCKPAAAGLALVFCILDVFPLRRLDLNHPSAREARRVWAEKLPLLMIAAVFSGLAMLARPAAPPDSAAPAYGLASRVALTGDTVAFAPVKLVWPVGLVPFSALPASGAEASVLMGFAVAVVLSFVAVVYRRSRPGILAAWMSYLVLVAPVGHIAWVNPSRHFDRYTYLASMPLVALIAGILVASGAAGRIGRSRILAAITLAVIISLAVLGWRQCRVWRDSRALWEQALNQNVHPPLVHTNLASALREQGRLREALAHSAEAVGLRPSSASAHNNLGALLAELGRSDEAEAQYREALRLDPDLASANNNIGGLLLDQGKLALAAEHCTRAVRRRPESALYRAQLGEALLRLGKLDAAIDQLTIAVNLDPNLAVARQHLAQALARRNPFGQAYSLPGN